MENLNVLTGQALRRGHSPTLLDSDLFQSIELTQPDHQPQFVWEQSQLWKSHRKIAAYNVERITPSTPTKDWKEQLERGLKLQLLEGEILHWELEQIKDQATSAPSDPDAFMDWFENLKRTGPGQNDPLFDWLAEEADGQSMRWFIQQEVAGEAGFDDLAALTQIKLPTRPKLEVARNYWDEMGRGGEKGMHGPMLSRLAEELGIDEAEHSHENIVTEALALGNVLLGFALNRRYAYHSVGALGAVELTAPDRAHRVYLGLKRLGISPQGQSYFKLHSTVDIRHSEEWNKEVIRPLIEEAPELIPAIAEGALARLNAGARCFDRYRQVLEID